MESTALAATPPASSADLVPQMIMTPAEMKRRLDELQAFVNDVMQEEVHYGPAFPGSKKLVLYKAGGEMLAEIYGFKVIPRIVSRIEIWSTAIAVPVIPARATDDLGRQMEGTWYTSLPEKGPFFHYEFEAEVFSKRTGILLGKGFGSCNTMENRYRWRQGARVCPECGMEGAIIKGRAEYGGGWLCFKKKGGCGALYKGDDAKEIEAQEGGRVENDDIATLVNTVLKIGKKRSALDAIISVTQSSGLFEPDDDDDQGGDVVARKGESRDKGKPNGRSPAGRTKVMAHGQEHFTLGCTGPQLIRIWSIEKDYDKQHGANSHKAALKQLCGVESSVDLTEELAKRVIDQGLPAPAKGDGGDKPAAAPTTGAQQELGQRKAPADDENPYA